MSLLQKFNLRSKGDSRGELVILEAQRDIPFEIKRLYFLKNLDFSQPRGFHAHKELKQVAICISGSCKMLLDNGIEKETIEMNSHSEGVLIDSMVWHEMFEFSEDCIFLVLASDYYFESDYIRDYESFKRKLSELNT